VSSRQWATTARSAHCAALRATLEDSRADVVVAGTPIDLASVLDRTKPVIRARYGLIEVGEPKLGARIDEFMASVPPPRRST